MKSTLLILFVCVCYQFKQGTAHGCIPRICEGNDDNEFRKCMGAADKDGDNTCGKYGSERWGSRLVMGVDLRCDLESKVYAPFNGTIFYYTPFGDGTCLDMGVKIEGSGAWQGYFATISYMKPYKMSGKVKQGELIGRVINVRECNQELASQASGNHVLFQMYKFGLVMDPTSHLQNCMCTGQICQSNPKNSMTQAYKSHDQFGTGFELTCTDLPVSSVDQDVTDTAAHVPLIYSPIDGKRLGRMRLRDPKDSVGDCTNDAVFIIGDGKWKDYTVRIYNAKFIKEKLPGFHDIKQGDPVARRLDCDDDQQMVFLEFRHRGQLVNITKQITGDKCHMPQH